MKSIKIFITLVSFVALTGIGGAYNTSLDDFAKTQQEKTTEEKKQKKKNDELKETIEEQTKVDNTNSDSSEENSSKEISNVKSEESNKVASNSSNSMQQSQIQVDTSSTQNSSMPQKSSQQVQAAPNQNNSSASVDCNIPLFDGDYVDFTNYNDVLNFKNRVNTEVGGKISWRDVVGKCGTILGYRVEVYVNGQTYSKSSYESSF